MLWMTMLCSTWSARCFQPLKVERVFRDFYAGHLGEGDLEERLLRDVDERRFRDICQTALEGLATKKLNLAMLVERRARAQERRVVPETIARFMTESAERASLGLNPVRSLPHTFEPGPNTVRSEEIRARGRTGIFLNWWRDTHDFQQTAATAEERNLEWVTPGHPLFEALRRHSLELGREVFAAGACFHSLDHDSPARLDFYRARVVDGLGSVIHERLFALELSEGKEPVLREPEVIGNLTPTAAPETLPAVASLTEATSWLNERALMPFIDEIRAERMPEVDRIAEHVELALTEVLSRIDLEIGRAAEEVDKQVVGAEGRQAQAEARHAEALARRERRRQELTQQRALTLQGVERLASVMVIPHPERESEEVQRLRPNPETEMTAMEGGDGARELSGAAGSRTFTRRTLATT